MKWLLDLGAQYRQNLLSGSFYTQLAAARHPDDVRGWVRQLYYQSSDFTSALAMRYSMCRDFRYQGCFARHATDGCWILGVSEILMTANKTRLLHVY
ncbi:hypothetical protein [Microcoleus sp.]|uniref:hypothetical protein n=1 Tax=Microcoleus sp. TaxID=44472 RepID=UPI0035263B35